MNLSFSNFILYLASLAFVAKAQESDHNNIIGGTEVTRGRYPYQVALAQDFSGIIFWTGCGGTLIAPGYVLSAAHCGINTDINLVWIGRHDLEDSSEEYESINVVEKILHPCYDDSSLQNDVMILKLESDSTAQVVTYDTGDADTCEGNPVTVMGWGSTTDLNGDTSDVLLEVEVDTVSNSDCCDRWGGEKITDGMLCAERADKGSCTGDSGGPLIIAGEDAASDMQVGIVSFGSADGCTDPEVPSVFARVSEYDDWIKCLVDGGTASDCEASARTSTGKGYLIKKMMRGMNL